MKKMIEEEFFGCKDDAFAIYQIVEPHYNYRLREKLRHTSTYYPNSSLANRIDKAKYSFIYASEIERVNGLEHTGNLLSYLYRIFNGLLSGYPEDYNGKAMSFYDIIVINNNGKLTTYFVNPTGWVEIEGIMDK